MRNAHKQLNAHRRKGFTLVELMVVVVIIGLIASIATIQIIGAIHKGKVAATKAQIKVFKNAVKQYKIDTGQYPDESEGLFALTENRSGVTGWDPAGYIDGGILPMDPWKNEYVYELTGDPQRPYEVYSFGADGKEGGEGEDADIFDFDLEDIGG